jgi:hypothetical protein
MTAQQSHREIPKRRKGADHFGYGYQVALGKNEEGDGLWHSHGKHYHKPDTYWCGNWGDRTPEELLSECESVIADMRLYHPELFKSCPHNPAPDTMTISVKEFEQYIKDKQEQAAHIATLKTLDKIEAWCKMEWKSVEYLDEEPKDIIRNEIIAFRKYFKSLRTAAQEARR